MIEKILKTLIILVVIGTTSYLIYSRLKTDDVVAKNIGFPNFHFITLNGDIFETSDLSSDKNLVVSFFNTDCGHCQALADDVKLKMNRFLDTEFLWASNMSESQIRSFGRTHGLASHNNFHFVKTEGEEFFNAFGNQYVPLIYVYNKEGTRVGSFKEDCSTSDILRVLRK